jgi:hypothetical protein
MAKPLVIVDVFFPLRKIPGANDLGLLLPFDKAAAQDVGELALMSYCVARKAM